MWSADRHEVKFILATDPDADRLAVAERLDDESWHAFTGNQLGILLAYHVLETYGGDRKKLAMLCSTVSSRMLAVLAEKERFHFTETLTGFKWMGNKSEELDAEGYDTRFAFEESIGYMVPGVVRDKDGVAASALFLAAAAHWHASEQLTPYGKLQSLYKKYGYFEESNAYFITPSPAITEKIFDTIRGLGNPYPKSLGTRKIHRWRDLTKGWDSSTSHNKPHLPVDSSSQMITCELNGAVRMTIRASGTEPKIKVYIEGHAHHQESARKAADEVKRDLIEHWLKPVEYGLVTSA